MHPQLARAADGQLLTRQLARLATLSAQYIGHLPPLLSRMARVQQQAQFLVSLPISLECQHGIMPTCCTGRKIKIAFGPSKPAVMGPLAQGKLEIYRRVSAFFRETPLFSSPFPCKESLGNLNQCESAIRSESHSCWPPHLHRGVGWGVNGLKIPPPLHTHAFNVK